MLQHADELSPGAAMRSGAFFCGVQSHGGDRRYKTANQGLNPTLKRGRGTLPSYVNTTIAKILKSKPRAIAKTTQRPVSVKFGSCSMKVSALLALCDCLKN